MFRFLCHSLTSFTTFSSNVNEHGQQHIFLYLCKVYFFTCKCYIKFKLCWYLSDIFDLKKFVKSMKISHKIVFHDYCATPRIAEILKNTT